MTKELFKSTGIVSGFTLVSRILGLARDVVFAQFLGASAGPGMDAFLVAFRIPNFMRRLFAEGAFSQAFVPVFAAWKGEKSPEEVRELARSVAGTLGTILLVVSLLGMVGAPVLVTVFAFGFVGAPDKFQLTVDLLRITFPYVVFISLTALAGGILNTYDRYGVPAFTPVLLNICLIAMAIGAAPYFDPPELALAIGVFLAGVAQLALQLPFLKQLGLLGWPRWAWRHPGVQRIKMLMVPALFGSSVTQFNLLFDTVIASMLATGSIAWLYYSDRLIEFPLGVFGVAMATVLLPNLSQRFVERQAREFSRMLDWSLRWALLLAVPATVGLVILAGPILATFFFYGKFTLEDTRMATWSLTAYAFGLVGFVGVKVLVPGFYARQDSRTPVRVGIIAILSNMVLVGLLVVPWYLLGLPGPHAGLALATGISAYLNAGLLLKILQQQKIYTPEPGWRRFLLRLLVANGVMAGLLVMGVADISQWAQQSLWERVGFLTLWVLAGAGSYLITLLVMGLRPRDLLLQ